MKNDKESNAVTKAYRFLKSGAAFPQNKLTQQLGNAQMPSSC